MASLQVVEPAGIRRIDDGQRDEPVAMGPGRLGEPSLAGCGLRLRNRRGAGNPGPVDTAIVHQGQQLGGGCVLSCGRRKDQE